MRRAACGVLGPVSTISGRIAAIGLRRESTRGLRRDYHPRHRSRHIALDAPQVSSPRRTELSRDRLIDRVDRSVTRTCTQADHRTDDGTTEPGQLSDQVPYLDPVRPWSAENEQRMEKPGRITCGSGLIVVVPSRCNAPSDALITVVTTGRRREPTRSSESDEGRSGGPGC
jgi:hypothetical protein